MINEKKSQAQQHIETVVAGYRNDETRTNYRWKVKDAYKTNSDWYMPLLTLGIVFFIGVYTGRLNIPRNYSFFSFIPVLLIFVYNIVTVTSKRFQEKSWFNDWVSDEDILRLCENPDLKPLIKKDIEHGYLLTYTKLHERLPNYLSQIEAYYGKIHRDVLIRKIDQN